MLIKKCSSVERINCQKADKRNSKQKAILQWAAEKNIRQWFTFSLTALGRVAPTTFKLDPSSKSTLNSDQP